MLANNSTNSQKLTFIEKKTDLALLAALAIWFLAFQKGVTTAYQVWVISDIFNHCLFVIPISFLLIWQKRASLQQVPARPQAVWLLLLLPVTLIYIFAYAGDIAVLMHIATFSALPIIILSIIGYQASKVILFPLAFILFSIPVGEELIPTLQQTAATIAITLLKIVNIPTYINGLYIEIPKGRFLVAEACSGISFFIVSIVFGCLFAYTSFYTLKRKLLFVAISFIVPILANGIRVFGIIYIAHLTDMQYAAGADHLIYGWFFYCLVLGLLILLGNSMRDSRPPSSDASPTCTTQPLISPQKKSVVVHTCLLMILLVSQIIWINRISSPTPSNITLTVSNQYQHSADSFAVQPKIIDTDLVKFHSFKQDSLVIDVYTAYFAANSKGELVSGLHRRFDPNSWSLKSSTVVPVSISNEEFKARLSDITSPIGENRLLLDVYVSNRYIGYSAIKTKLLQTLDKFLGADKQSHLILVSIKYKDLHEKQVATPIIINTASQLIEELNSVYE